MISAPLHHRLVRAAALVEPDSRPADREAGLWRPAELAGRLCELAADPHGVHLTLACALIRAFQHAAEPVVWVTASHDTFFPPDVAHSGVDLGALPVVTVPGLRAVVTAAERLTRCGAFGLVVLELGSRPVIPAALLGRLVRLARRHDTALLCLTTPDPGATLGSLVAVRGRGFRDATPRAGYFRCGIQVFKDRQRGPGGSLAATYRAPHGLC